MVSREMVKRKLAFFMKWGSQCTPTQKFPDKLRFEKKLRSPYLIPEQ